MFCKIGEIVCLNECKDALVAFVWFFSTVCFQMLSPIVCLHTYNHTCCIVTRWNGFSPECFLCDLSNRCRKSYICHTNYRRNVLKSFFHFRSGARCDEGLPEENGLPASEPAEGAEKVQEGKVDARGGRRGLRPRGTWECGGIDWRICACGWHAWSRWREEITGWAAEPWLWSKKFHSCYT